MKNDHLNNNTDIKYDHRNLITEITRENKEGIPVIFTTTYKYDEAGNRTQKTVSKDDGSTMEIIVNEYYIRDVSGKETAIYQNDTLKFWNVWGLGNEGRITSEGTRYYYIKDHLGSTRAVLNDNNELVEAIDYDPWGHIARYWTTSPTKYKFTGKELDNETGYDYFGARYYDARIGRWGQIEPLLENYLSFTAYNFCLNNPIKIFDINGNEVRATSKDAQEMILNTLPSEIRTSIQFNEYGFIDKESLNSIDNASDNFAALKQLVNDKQIFDVIIGSKFIYVDESGVFKEVSFGQIEIDNLNSPSPFSPQTGEFGYYGVILIPGNEPETYNAPYKDVEIHINVELSTKGRSQTFAHEAYGHAYFYSMGKEYKHIPKNINGYFIEMNKELGNQITNRIKETIKNTEE